MLVWAQWLQGQQTCVGKNAVALGPTNVCCCECGGSKVSNSVLAWAWRYQGQQFVAGVKTNEPGRAGYQNVHSSSSGCLLQA